MRDVIILLALYALAFGAYRLVKALARGSAACVGCGHMNHLHLRGRGCVAAGTDEPICSCPVTGVTA